VISVTSLYSLVHSLTNSFIHSFQLMVVEADDYSPFVMSNSGSARIIRLLRVQPEHQNLSWGYL